MTLPPCACGAPAIAFSADGSVACGTCAGLVRHASGLILAIDPGKTGALAWVSGDGHLIAVEDMPVIQVRGKDRISPAGLANMIRARMPAFAVIEQVGAMPGQGVTSMFNFGFGAGMLEGVIAALGIPYDTVPSASWKKKAGVSSDKGACRQMATRLWPGAADHFRRVKDDGRADAALLGRWWALKDRGMS